MNKLKFRRATLLVLLAYTGLTVIMTWPLAARLGAAIPGLVGDSFVHLWTFEWVKNSLAAGQSPFYTNLLFYPNGVTLIFHNIAWLNIAVWLPLQAIVGAAAAYTLVHMGVLVFNGFAMYLLAREVAKSEKAAFVAGLVAAYWPFIMSHQDHPNLILVGWISLALLYLSRLFTYGRTRDALLVALFIILAGISRWQVLIMAAPLLGFSVLYGFASQKAARSWLTVKQLLLVGVLVVAGLTPLLAPLAYSQFTRENSQDLFVDEELMVTDLLGFVVPSRYHPLWGRQGLDWSWNLAGNVNYIPFLGFTTLVLAGVGVFLAWKRAGFWLFAALFYAVMSLGPELYVNGQAWFPLPYTLIADNFLVQTIRHPERLNVMLSIPVAVLAGLGVMALGRRPFVRRHERLVLAGFSLLILAEYINTFPVLEITTPAWYKQLAQESGEFAILDIPMHMRRKYDKQYMMYQLTHGRPLVEGHVSRPPREVFDFINSVPFLAGSREQKYPPDDVVDVSRQMQRLSAAGIRYLALHKQFLHDDQEAAWRDWLTAEPAYEDDDVVVYETAAIVFDQNFEPQQLLTTTADGRNQISLIRAAITPTRTTQGGWALVDTRWGSRAPVTEDYNVCLTLQAETGGRLTAHCQPVSPDWPTSRWEAGEIVRAVYQFQAQPDWEPGAYTMLLGLVDSQNEPVGETAVIGQFQLDGIPRSFTPPAPGRPADANWAGLIALTGYDLTLAGDSLDLTLYWQALQEMDTGYKIFLHVADAQTGRLAAQTDFIPQNWTYPTDWWAAGEYINDPVSLSLTDAPPGEYRLWLGIYHPDTGQRLPLSDAAGLDTADDALLLASFSIPTND